MTKIGVFINSNISNSEFEEIIEPYLKNKSIVIYSNYKHDQITFVDNNQSAISDPHLLCRERITKVSNEFYKRFENTPLWNKQFNFWPHLRFNAYLQMLTYYGVKDWLENVNLISDDVEFVFVGVSQNTTRLINLDYKKVSFLSNKTSKNKSVSKKKVTLNFLKALFNGGLRINTIFRKQKDNLLISIRGSVNKIHSKDGLIDADKFMYYIGDEFENDSYETLLNSNLFSKNGLKDYSNDAIQKSFDITGDSILFYALFKPKFYKEFVKTRKFLKKINLKQDSLLDVILSNNKSGVYTELLTYWSYYMFFKKRNYKNIVLISEMSPATNSIVRVSKQFGINSIGIQHGITNKNSFSYNYTNKELEIDNPFPSKLIVWGKEEDDFFAKNKKILENTVQTKGNVVLDGLKYLPVKKEINKFTVLYATQPQPILSHRMKSITDFVDAMLRFDSKEIKIIIRLHPREVNNYDLYREQLDKLNNYDLEIDKGEELFSQINRSDVVVTSYSTVSKDAMILRKPIVLQDYSENDITGLIERDVAFNTLNSEKMFSVLEQLKSKKITIKPEKFEKALSEIYASSDFEVATKILMLLK